MSLTVVDLLPGATLPSTATTEQPPRRYEHLALVVDEPFTTSKTRELAWSLGPTDFEGGIFFTAPVVGVGRSPDGSQSAVMLAPARPAEVGAAFAEDRVPELLAEHADMVSPLGGVVR